MIGRAVYLSSYKEKEIYRVENQEFVYFTSLHIPEEFGYNYSIRVDALLRTLLNTGNKVIVDISPRGLKALGIKTLLEFFKKYPVYGVRADYGISTEDLIAIPKDRAICINASMTEKDFIDPLISSGHTLIGIHNFYPRPETGLDEAYIMKQNQLYKKLGINVWAFISGDRDLREPLYAGLPTLEKHRNLLPYISYIQLKHKFNVDGVLIGDPGISKFQFDLIKQSEKDSIVRIPVILDREWERLYNNVFTIREDSPCWLARLKESRNYASVGDPVIPHNTTARLYGSITVDNERYGRYSGEIQILKGDFKQDDRVNVIGKVVSEYEGLLEVICGGVKIMMIKI